MPNLLKYLTIRTPSVIVNNFFFQSFGDLRDRYNISQSYNSYCLIQYQALQITLCTEQW